MNWLNKFQNRGKDRGRLETTEKVGVQKTALQNRGNVACFILK